MTASLLGGLLKHTEKTTDYEYPSTAFRALSVQKPRPPTLPGLIIWRDLELVKDPSCEGKGHSEAGPKLPRPSPASALIRKRYA